jgi:AbrB family looped-hinge helix DNA binding protein
MRITIKGQVTIPQHIREKLGLTPATEVEFVEEKGKVYIVKRPGTNKSGRRFRKLRGVATVRMTTDEIMALTREES